ncbi:ribonuclease H [Verrucomicrobia bacterium]|jgi:ribonuclease HI|nr:ribonuclease H [Verrucomicrobiota bacterium]
MGHSTDFGTKNLSLDFSNHPSNFLQVEARPTNFSAEPTTFLFTDGSVDTQSKIGWGASLVVSSLNLSHARLSKGIKTRCFEDTSSSKLELQTILWALGELKSSRVIAYSDSQNIVQLPARRYRLEEQDYVSKSGKPLNHRELYKELYKISDQIDLEIRKVKGHAPGPQRDQIQEIFALVDKASRSALRAATTRER